MDIFWHFWISKCGCFCPIFVYSKPKHPPSFISITWVTPWYSRLNLLPGLKAERITSRQGASDLRPRATLRSALHARPLPIHPNLISCSTPYQSLVLSRARRYSGTPTHRLAEDRKSSGMCREFVVKKFGASNVPPMVICKPCRLCLLIIFTQWW